MIPFRPALGVVTMLDSRTIQTKELALRIVELMPTEDVPISIAIDALCMVLKHSIEQMPASIRPFTLVKCCRKLMDP